MIDVRYLPERRGSANVDHRDEPAHRRISTIAARLRAERVPIAATSRAGTMAVVPQDAELLEVIRREKLLLDPALRASGDEMAALLHPDFVEFGVPGRAWDRESIVAALGSDPAVSGDGADFRAEALADNVVLLTYRISGERGSRRSSIWVREPGHGWCLRFHQGTRSN